MPSARNALFIVLVVGVGLIALLLVRSQSHLDPSRDTDSTVVIDWSPADGGAADSGGGTTEIVLVSPGREDAGGLISEGTVETTVIYPLEVDLSLVLPGSVDVPDGVMPIKSDANAGIEGVIRGPNGEPAQGTVLFVHGPNEGRELSTDSQGRYGANDLLQGVSIVRVTTVGGKTVERERILAQLTTAPFSISFANPSIVSGTVQDETGVKIDGAEVRLDGRLAFTDSDGRFTYTGVPAGRVLVTARQEGFTTTRRVVGVGRRTRVDADKFIISLGKSATLEISLEQTLGTTDPAIAFLMPAGGPSTTSADHSFPWYEINPVSIPRGGRAVIDGLPAVSVSVRVFHKGAVARPRSKSVRLYSGRKSAVVIALKPAPALRGLVLDGGKPVKGARIVIEAADRSTATSKALGERSPRFLLEVVVPPLPAAYQTTTTDSKGEFVFTSNPDVTTAYYVTATSRDGKREGVGVLASGDARVTVNLRDTEDETGGFQLELPGRFQGLPVELRIQGTPRDPFILRPGVPLLVDGLERGTWRVKARWRGSEVVFGKIIEIADEPAVLTGSLPEGALRGQTADERRRARGLLPR